MKSRELSEQIKQGELSARFQEICADAALAKRQPKRYRNAIAAFEHSYGEADVSIFSAPGRTEIGGNHTDHQRGEVLAAAINRDAIAVVKKTGGNEVRIISGSRPEVRVGTGDLSMKIKEEGTTTALVRGVLAGIQKKGYQVGGFDAYVTSDVLIGAGLSSSAAFETLIGTIESELYNDGRISPGKIAMIGRYAENIYFGKPCGLMDQMACSVGALVHIDFRDPEKPVVGKPDPTPLSDAYALCITDTGGSHADLTPDYAAIPAEMRSVAAHFGKEVLREVSEGLILENINELREKNGDRAVLRALHFYEENKRVRRETEALKNGDVGAFLAEVRASGASSFQYLQNVSTMRDPREQSMALALMLSEHFLGKEGASRVHGGGFAGTIQAWVPAEQAASYQKKMNACLGENACQILQIRKYGGIRVI